MSELLKRYGFGIVRAPDDGTGAKPEGSETGLVTDNAPAPDVQNEPPKDETPQRERKGLFAKPAEPKADDVKAPPPEDGRPEGLPDKYWNAKDKTVNVDALVKSHLDTEKALGELRRSKSVGGEVPKDVGEYFQEPIKLPDTVKNLSLEPDDPGLKAFAKICQERGIGKDAARSIVVEMFSEMNGFMPAPVDPEQERKALGAEGPAMADGLFGWMDNMERSGAISADDVDVMESLMHTAKGMRTLVKLRGMTGLEPIPTNVGNGVNAMSGAEWQVKMAEAIKTKDYAEQSRLEKIGEMINGTQAAGSSRGGSIGYAG